MDLACAYSGKSILISFPTSRRAAGHPLLYIFQAGKDRTGLVSMLALACTGAPDDIIVADYAKSDGFG